MALPEFTMRQLLEAGVHFGHHTRRWNPKMAPYIFGVRNGIHIIDLEQTVPLLQQGLAGDPRRRRRRRARALRRHQAPGAGGDRRSGQALRPVLCQLPLARRHADQLQDDLAVDQAAARARRAHQPAEETGLTKRELLELTRDRDKLERALGGIKEMGGLPDILFVIDTNKEAIAVEEANKLKHPGRRDPRHQLLAGRHRLSDPGQRRRDARDPSLLRPGRRRGARRAAGRAGRLRRRYRRAGRASRRRSPPDEEEPVADEMPSEAETADAWPSEADSGAPPRD